ncbi:hypothetical protein AB0F81_49740 [Actinoplanes sp. NPDC024001]|uniref:hypothetical protein n=1 Tax=Actinoplanes sp. NPDC024001 TaxID=3154598 RepID=UPI0033CF0E37
MEKLSGVRSQTAFAVPAGIQVVFRNLGDNHEFRRALTRLRHLRYEPQRRSHRRLWSAPPAAHRRWAARRPGDRWGIPRRRHR